MSLKQGFGVILTANMGHENDTISILCDHPTHGTAKEGACRAAYIVNLTPTPTAGGINPLD